MNTYKFRSMKSGKVFEIEADRPSSAREILASLWGEDAEEYLLDGVKEQEEPSSDWDEDFDGDWQSDSPDSESGDND